jgi:hypothetical protein
VFSCEKSTGGTVLLFMLLVVYDCKHLLLFVPVCT